MKRHVALIIMLAGLINCPAVFAADKNDVTDPVLQEIIAAFNPRMPRFIDKHGAKLFVADEPITRSSLMMALYEYDKSAKAIPAREYATRQEISDLRNRMAILEKNVSFGTPAAPESSDITLIINELAPNMPILLDNSLNSSKVFTKFKNDVLARQTAATTAPGINGEDTSVLAELTRRVERIEKSSGAGATTAAGVKTAEIAEINRRLVIVEGAMLSYSAQGKKDPVSAEIAELTRRVARMEKNAAASLADSKSNSDESELLEEIQKARQQEKNDFAKLEKRLGDVEKVSYSGKKSGDGTKQYSSLFTKVSFGLSILAAFYIAR